MTLKYFVLFGVAAVAFAQKGTGTGYGYGEEYGMEQCDGRANDLLMMVCTAQAPLFSKIKISELIYRRI